MGRLITREFKNKYNKKLEAYYKGERYIDDPKRTDLEVNKWLPRLIQYTKELSYMILEYEQITGEEMPRDTILGGFILYDQTN